MIYEKTIICKTCDTSIRATNKTEKNCPECNKSITLTHSGGLFQTDAEHFRFARFEEDQLANTIYEEDELVVDDHINKKVWALIEGLKKYQSENFEVRYLSKHKQQYPYTAFRYDELVQYDEFDKYVYWAGSIHVKTAKHIDQIDALKCVNIMIETHLDNGETITIKARLDFERNLWEPIETQKEAIIKRLDNMASIIDDLINKRQSITDINHFTKNDKRINDYDKIQAPIYSYDFYV